MPHLTPRRFVWLYAFILAANASVAHAQCPQSTVSCFGEGSSGPFDVTETSNAPSARVSYRSSWASYDLTSGTIGAMAFVEIESWHHSSRTIAADVFELHGVPAAGVRIRLRLSAQGVTDPGERQAWVVGTAHLTAQGQTVSTETRSIGFHVPFLEISTDLLENEPLEVIYEARAEGWGYEPALLVIGQIEFVGLPNGAWVTSCNGFNSTPVPADATTWGAVKEMYRTP